MRDDFESPVKGVIFGTYLPIRLSKETNLGNLIIPKACSNDYSAEEMETFGYIALMQLSLKCFKDMITSSCDNQVR